MNTEVLLAGSLGALGVFGLGVLRDYVWRMRELRGLTRLLWMELQHNEGTLRSCYEGPEWALTPEAINSLRMDTWEDSRVRLASMMPTNDFGSVSFYYMFLHELMRVQATQRLQNDPRENAVKILELVREQEQDAIAATLAYSNLRGMFALWRARRKVSSHRGNVSESESEK